MVENATAIFSVNEHYKYNKLLFRVFCNFVISKQVFDIFSQCAVSFFCSSLNVLVNFVSDCQAFVSFTRQKKIELLLRTLPYDYIYN